MKVYKYRGGPNLQLHLDTLAQNQFWAPRADQLNDPAEAYVNDRSLREALKLAGAESVRESFDALTQMRHVVGVYSLSRTPLDELMWAYYAEGHAGFCIEYDLERLRLEARAAWNVLDVSYHNDPQTISLDDVFASGSEAAILSKMIGTKSIRWAHEEETRIVTTNPGVNHFAADAVTGLYFGCRCNDDFIAAALAAMKGRRLKCFRMRFSPDSYAMLAEELTTPAGSVEVQLAPVEEGAIPALDQVDAKYQPYYCYLQRAVERVRRDSSCKKVVLVDFSTSRGEKEKPVIFVQYETSVPTQFYPVLNQYVSIDELDRERE